MLAYATRLLGDRAGAEDVVQEALIRAWRNPDVLTNGKGSTRGWLLTVVRNLVIDRVRARAARPAEVAEDPDTQPSARDHADLVAASVTVQAALRELSEEHRVVVEQLYLEGRTPQRGGGGPRGADRNREVALLLRAARAACRDATGGAGMNGMHDPGELSAHALGLLGGAQARAVEQHLADCAACRREWSELRETAALLESVPPEMFLDGPPENDLLLQRTLRQIRTETGSRRSRRRFGLTVAAAVVAAALLGAGAFAGQQLPGAGRGRGAAARAAPRQPAPAPPAAGGRTCRAPRSVTMSTTVTQASGWVRVAASVRGIPPGELCSLYVIAQDGTEHLAGSWVVGVPGPTPGAPVQGSTIVAFDQVAGVRVSNEAGREFITRVLKSVPTGHAPGR